MRGIGERLIPLIGVGLCGVTSLAANFAFWGFCEVRLPPGARERENSDSFRADDPLFPKIPERVRL
jgi:hypothetical protein